VFAGLWGATANADCKAKGTLDRVAGCTVAVAESKNVFAGLRGATTGRKQW